MNSAPTPEGPGSVSGAPHLPDGFAGTFTSRYIDTGGLRQHVVTGGQGPPLLLVHGRRDPPAGRVPVPPLFANAHLNNALWHFGFNRLAAVNDQLVTGREEIYFGWQFATKAARPLPGYAVRHYIGTLAASPEALHASFAIYRALDATIAQNQERMTRRLRMPVLGIGGAHSLGDQVAATMKLAADDVQTLVIPGCAHWVAEETPEETLTALTAFLSRPN